MSVLTLNPVASDGFRVTPTLDGARLVLVFSGSGDMNAIELLSRFLKHVHEEAQRLPATEVSCDFRQLAFMNSSCFKSFVVWIDTVKNAAQRYQIHFLTNPDMHWQRRSLEALRRLAVNIVTIESATPS